MHVASHPHKNLKTLEILGYYGRVSDFELVLYAIENAAGLKKILIDPRHRGQNKVTTVKDFSKIEETAQSSAKRQFESVSLPKGVHLAIRSLVHL